MPEEKESDRRGGSPRGGRRGERGRDGGRREGSSPRGEGISRKGAAFLAVFFGSLVAVVVWLLVYGGVSPAERARRAVERPIGPLPDGDPPPIAAAGRVIYERNCMLCHGSRLSGGPAPSLRARRYEPSRWTNQDLANVVYAGSANMPAFKDTLSAGEIAAVVSYIRWEQGLPLPEAPQNPPESTPAP